MTMLDTDELRRLTQWCAVRSLRWRPLLHDGEVAVLIEPAGLGGAADRMVLTQPDSDLELATEAGDRLASATDLDSVLDVLDGGIAEVPHDMAARTSTRGIGAMVI